MPYRSHARKRLPPAVLTGSLVALALALACVAHPARADDAAAKPKTDATVRIKTFPPSIQIDSTTSDTKVDKGTSTDADTHGERHIRVEDDSNFDMDAFTGQVQKMPWIIGLIFLVVGSIFLTPVVLLIGIVWYKLRKTRLQNEAMLALAARGVVPPAQAAEALATGTPASTAAPQIYQQALALRKRVVWSDLRKGVIMVMVGLAFLLYGITGSGEPSWVGMILLFVGVGYLVLWWLEGRQLAQVSSTPPGNGSHSSGG